MYVIGEAASAIQFGSIFLPSWRSSPKTFSSECTHRYKIEPRFEKRPDRLSSLVGLFYIELTDVLVSRNDTELFPHSFKHGEKRKVAFLFKKWTGLGKASSLLFIIYIP